MRVDLHGVKLVMVEKIENDENLRGMVRFIIYINGNDRGG